MTDWNLPTIEKEFRAWLYSANITFAEFKQLAVYQDNKDKYPWLTNLEFTPIPDFKPGLLSDLMEKQPFHKEQK